MYNNNNINFVMTMMRKELHELMTDACPGVDFAHL